MQVVLLHSFWRTSSTYFWSKFRNLSNVKAFYEPFHESLQGSVGNKDLIVDSDSWDSRHPKEANYFREIISAYHQQNIDSYPDFALGWPEVGAGSLSAFHVEHLNNLLKAPCSADVDTLFFCFNRSMFNISHIHECVVSCSPGNVHSFVFFRDPCQQISSYLSQSKTGNLYFESRFYRLWLACPRFAGFFNSDSLSEIPSGLLFDEATLVETLKCMSVRVELSTFLYALTVVDSLFRSLELWSDDIQANFLSENIIYVDDLNHSRCSRDRLTSMFRELGVSLSLDDFNLPPVHPHVDILCINQAFAYALRLLMVEKKISYIPPLVAAFLNKASLDPGFLISSDEILGMVGSAESRQMSSFKRKIACQLEDFKKKGIYFQLQKQAARLSSLSDEISRLNKKMEILMTRNDKLEALLSASESNFAKLIELIRFTE